MKIKTQGKRIPQQPVEQPPPMIVLEMREEVAETLEIILNNIGGNETGRRGHCTELGRALHEAGIPDSYAHPDKYEGSIYFKPTVTR